MLYGITLLFDFETLYANMKGMLKIRLQRVGRKNDPSFRVVLTDSKNATRSGKFLEILGSYSARQGEPVINGERVKHWMSVGAKPSDTVHNLLVTKKVITGKKINVLPKKTVPKKEAEVREEKAEVAEPEALVAAQ